MKDIFIKGGGNVINICGNLQNNQKIFKSQSYPAVGQTTSDEQRQLFINNAESKIESLNNSSRSLKNQNSKMIFTQSLNWLQANQIVIFDLMLGFKKSDYDQIELFEDILLKLLQSILHILKRELNVYLGFIIAKQAAILATTIHKFYLHVGITNEKQSKMINYKSELNQILQKLFYTLEKFKEKNISTNYLEQSLKLIESFTFSLPQESTFKPFLIFATGFGQILTSGGIKGWDQIFNGIKDGVSQVVNKKIHQEQVDNFIMYGTLDTVKFSIIKILQKSQNFDQQKNDDKSDKNLEEIISTLQQIGKTVENSNNWLHKYYFVQMLGDLLQFQGIIDQDMLNDKLKEKDFPYDQEMVWQVLIQNNWVIQFKQDESQTEKTGFLKQKRTTLENFSLKKNKKIKNRQLDVEDGLSHEDKEEFISELNKIFNEFEPIKPSIREYILKGNKVAFKGLLTYCFEGLDSSENITKEAVLDLYQGRNPLEVLEISLKRTLNFAMDFFAQQFDALTLNTETQLRNVFINIMVDRKEEIALYIKTNQFNSIINTNQSFKSFPKLITNYLEQITGFINKILDYLKNIFDPLHKIQFVIELIQDPTQQFKQYLIKQSSTQFQSLIEDQNNIISEIEIHLQQYNDLIQGCGKFLELIDYLQMSYNKIQLNSQLIVLDGIDQVQEPVEISRLRQFYKKISTMEVKEQKYSYIRSLLNNSFTDIISNRIYNEFIQEIQNNVNNFDINALIELKLEEFKQQAQVNQQYNLYEGVLFYNLKLIDELLKNSFKNYENLIVNLEKLKKEAFQNESFTTLSQQIQKFNSDIILYIKENPEYTLQDFQLFLQQQSAFIQQQEIELEFKNEFVQSCYQIKNLFGDLMKLTTLIFQDINKIEKYTDPIIFQSINPQLNELKAFVSNDLEQIKETMLDDIQSVYQQFEKSELAQDINKAVSQLRSLTEFLDVGGLMSILQDKYNDQTWRIRDLAVLILFDLNQNFGGQDGDQIYANTLIHIKAIETNQKVQQTLKNEEIISQMKSILQTNWKSQESQIKNYVQDHFKSLEEYVKKMKEEKNLDPKKILKNYEKKEQQLNQQLDNIQDIGSLAGIQLEFLKDIKKQIFKLQQDVEVIKETMKQVEENMLLLKGKSVYQLFEERRKQKIIDMRIDKQKQVYIPIRASKIIKKQKVGLKNFQFINYDHHHDESDEYHKKIGEIQSIQNKPELIYHQETQLTEDQKRIQQARKEFIETKFKNRNKQLIKVLSKTLINQNLQTLVNSNYILDNFMNDHYNSLLIHGHRGSGKSRLCHELELKFWLQRKVTKQQLLKSILTDFDTHSILSNFSVDDIYDIINKYQFIDKQGYFTDNFIQIESEFEDIKFANRIRKEQENKDSQQEKEDKGLDLEDIQTEGGQIFFQKRFSEMFTELDKKVVTKIYQVLDDIFQSKPYPIFVELSKIMHPQGDLLKEVLQSTEYNFEDHQIRKVRELAQQGDINLVFILDDYFSMKQEFIGLNIFTNNNLELLRRQDDFMYSYPKVIITCRSNYLTMNNYSSIFQNIFNKSQKFDYHPDHYHLEYCVDDLSNIQINQYFYQKFIKTLQSICYKQFSKKFIQKSSQKNINEEMDIEFKQFWQVILESVKKNNEQNNLWLSKEFKHFLIDSFKQKSLLSADEEICFSTQLNKVYTQRMYDKIVVELNIKNLLNSVLMIHIFINAIEQLVEKLCSKQELQQRIKSALIQDNILQNHETINIDSIINLLCQGNQDLLENFSYCWEEEETIKNIQNQLESNYIIKDNQELLQKLTSIIFYAMYFKHITRYQLYDIFYSNYIKNQIELLKTQRKLFVNQDVMLKDCKKFAYRLAEAFHAHDKKSFKRMELSQLYWKKNIWDEFFNDTEQPLRELVRSCLPFISNGNIFHFMHESIKDFVLAHEYFDKVNKLKLNDQFIKIMNQFKKKLKQSDLIDQITPQVIDHQSLDSIDISQQGVMDIFLKQTTEIIKLQNTMKQEVIGLKKEILDIKKQLNQKELEKENTTYLDILMNNDQDQQQFITYFIKKTQQKINQKDIQEYINDIFSKTQNIIQQQLNKSAQFYDHKNIGICDLLIDKMRIMEIPDMKNHFIDSLHLLIQLGRLDERFSHTAANAIGLLILRNYSFNKIDFSGLDFCGCNLYGGQFFKCVFDNCNLERTNLQQCIFYKCQFFNTKLNFSNLQNCQLSKSNFANNSQLNNIILGRELDIVYDDQIQKDSNSHFVHAIVDPIYKDCLIIFHTWFVFRINISSSRRPELIKNFTEQIARIPIIQFKKYQYIIGMDKKLGLFDLETLEFTDWIYLKNIEQIYSIQFNQQNNHILVGGITQSGDKYIEISQFLSDSKGDSKVLTDQCDYVLIIPSKQQIMCHSNLYIPKIQVLIFDQFNYSPIDTKKDMSKQTLYKLFGNFKSLIDLQQNISLYHPKDNLINLKLQKLLKNIYEIIITREEDIEVKQYDQDGAFNLKIKKKIHIINQIRLYDMKKFGNAYQIIVNPNFPDLIFCVYSYGLIQIFQFTSEVDKNYQIHKDDLQVSHMQFLLKVENKDQEFLTCYINDSYSGIVGLALLTQYILEGQVIQFSINAKMDLKTKKKSKDEVVKNKIIGMLNHKQLINQFLLIVLQNKELVLKFTINNDLSQTSKMVKKEVIMISDLTEQGWMFENYQVHPDNHEIFCFSFNQAQIPFIVFYDLIGRQKLKQIQFEDLSISWKFFYDSRNIIIFNRQGDIKLLNINGEITNDISNESKINQICSIIGLQPNRNDILILYDYLGQNLIKYNLDNKTIQSTLIDGKFEFHHKGKKIYKNCSHLFESVKNDLEEHQKRHDRTLQIQIEKHSWEEALQNFKDRIQLIFHPILAFIFIVFNEEQNMLVYSLDKDQIIQKIQLHFYFDPSVQLNIVSHAKNQNITILSYSSHIQFLVYSKSEKGEEFKTIYQKSLAKTFSIYDETLMDSCMIDQQNYTILKQHGVKVTNSQLIKNSDIQI